jgi:hypothetical protein
MSIMGKKDQPAQSFAEVIETADRGKINRILSGDLAEIVDITTTKASLHESEWKGEMTIKIKVSAEADGKITMGFSRTKKIDEEKMPKARMYHNPDTGALTVEEPRQVKIPGFEDDGRKGPAKSAKAPGSGNEGSN